MFIDSHCHLHFIDYDKLNLSEEQVIENALKNDVKHMMCVSTNFNQLPQLIEIKKRYPSIVNISAGLHPNEVLENQKEFSVEDILKVIEDLQISAIGETGLDYYRDTCDRDLQKMRFLAHINAAKISKKPLIIHVRDSKDEVINILQKEKSSDLKGVVHCFTDDLATAKKYLNLGYYLSFSGVVTFPNAKELRSVLKNIPLERILIETDAPYLAPKPIRGKINLPEYVRFVAKEIAKEMNVHIEDVAKVTTQNYIDLFGIDE